MSPRALVSDFVDATFRFLPHHATAKGFHRYDQLPATFPPEEVARYRSQVARLQAGLEGVRPAALPLAERIDLELFRGHLDLALFFVDELGWLRRNPYYRVEALLESLDALERAPGLDEGARAAALRARLGATPAALDTLVGELREPMRPYVTSAAEMVEGAIEELAAAAPSAESLEATRALEAFLGELRRRERDARPFEAMGEARYRRLLRERHGLDEELSAYEALARRTLAHVAQTLEGAADEPEGAPPPPGFGRDDVLAYYADELRRVRAFIEERGLLTLPDVPVELREMPAHLAAVSPPLFYEPPGAFADERIGYFYVRPVPRELDDDERAYHWRRVSRRLFANAVAHEVWPGHHVQLSLASLHPRPLRKLFDDDVMVEGWGLYSEALMREEGLWEDRTPVRSLQMLAFRAARVLADIAIHTGRLDLPAAGRLMADAMGAEPAPWLEREIRRYAAEPGQAMSYLVGLDAILRLRDDWRAHRGEAFSLRDFHDRFLAEGSIPVSLIRWAMLGTPPRGLGA